MDAHALLTSQGWRGTGHSLHKSDDRIGLAKPILVSRKNNVLGVGRKSHVTSDQWWLNALDEQLKNLDTSGKTSIVQNKTAGNKATKLDALLTHGAGKYSGANGLYSFFVSGGLLQGTLIKHDEEGSNTEATTTPEAEEAVPVRKESKEERRARREEKRKRKAAKLAKQELRVAEAARLIRKEGSRKSKDASKKMKKSNADAASTAVTIKGSKMRGDKESKEERRARKEAKRKRHEDKEKKRKAGGG